jgi:uncharacterized membrane protein YsdA (DUF1294 family)/cold shock CspA family protein
MPARLHGRITQWFEDRGHGFITASGGSKQVFLHVSALKDRAAPPRVGDTVTFFLERDAQGRPRARAVQYANRDRGATLGSMRSGDSARGSTARRSTSRPSKPTRTLPTPTAVPWTLPLLVVGVVLALSLAGRVPMWAPAIYALASLLSWLLYGWDKGQAEAGTRRVPENTLHLLALVGGWPGAWVAQAQFRHKTKTASFRAVFWLTVLLNVAALGWTAVEGELPRALRDALYASVSGSASSVI